MVPNHSRYTLLIVLFACFALLAARVNGTHLHLCFDGQEVPAEIHLGDAGLHDDHPLSTLDLTHAEHHHALLDIPAHDDVDIDITADSLSKLPKLDWPVMALLVMLVFSLSGLGSAGFWPRHRALHRSSPHIYLRPPLRGPPLLTSL